MTPKRIQRQRTKGWRMPEGAVYVGRPSRWGNPFIAWPDDDRSNMTPAQAVEHFERALIEGRLLGKSVADVRTELNDKDLACWCPIDQPCHADVLLELANR